MKSNGSKLITKSNMYALTEGSKHIVVSSFDANSKYGYKNRYIPNTAANRNKIINLKGKPTDTDIVKGKKRFLWF